MKIFEYASFTYFIPSANSLPIKPRQTAAIKNTKRNLASKSGIDEIAYLSCLKPRSCVTKFARYEHAKHGITAPADNLPTQQTSIPKNAPANGVPKTEPNAELIPLRTIVLRSLFLIGNITCQRTANLNGSSLSADRTAEKMGYAGKYKCQRCKSLWHFFTVICTLNNNVVAH